MVENEVWTPKTGRSMPRNAEEMRCGHLISARNQANEMKLHAVFHAKSVSPAEPTLHEPQHRQRRRHCLVVARFWCCTKSEWDPEANANAATSPQDVSHHSKRPQRDSNLAMQKRSRTHSFPAQFPLNVAHLR